MIKNPSLKKEVGDKNNETIKIIQAIEQSGQGMWYYNQNQIQRMKIQKNEFKFKPSKTKNLESFITKVLYPFERQILRQEISLFISTNFDQSMLIKADWLNYQLILFNMIQNSVKYNKFKGDIFIIIKCLPLQKKIKLQNKLHRQMSKSLDVQAFKDQMDYVLETEIIDTGIGISKKRQKMLFIPFLELKMKQNLK